MNDAKKRILTRRAQFIAAAIAGLTAQACGKEDGPKPCLSAVAYPPDAGAPAPTVDYGGGVLAPPPAPVEAGAPHPCLTMKAPTAPKSR